MLKSQIRTFLIVGLLTVIVDFVFYKIFSDVMMFSIELAKSLGFVTGTFFAFVANKYWTFSDRKPGAASVYKFIILYSVTLFANVCINSIILKNFSTFEYSMELAFLVATGGSAMLNFIGMKFFVFK
jgi:putative flippase GtrA